MPSRPRQSRHCLVEKCQQPMLAVLRWRCAARKRRRYLAKSDVVDVVLDATPTISLRCSQVYLDRSSLMSLYLFLGLVYRRRRCRCRCRPRLRSIRPPLLRSLARFRTLYEEERRGKDAFRHGASTSVATP